MSTSNPVDEEPDALPVIADILEGHGVALIKLASLLQGGHMSMAEALAGITIAAEELLALKKVLVARTTQSSSESTG
jgi:hypothetical protein